MSEINTRVHSSGESAQSIAQTAFNNRLDGPPIGDLYELLSTLPKSSIDSQPADGVEDDAMMDVDTGGRSGEKREGRQKVREALLRTQETEEASRVKKAKLGQAEEDHQSTGEAMEGLIANTDT